MKGPFHPTDRASSAPGVSVRKDKGPQAGPPLPVLTALQPQRGQTACDGRLAPDGCAMLLPPLFLYSEPFCLSPVHDVSVVPKTRHEAHMRCFCPTACPCVLITRLLITLAVVGAALLGHIRAGGLN